MIRRQPAAEIFLVLFTSLFLPNLREVETYSSALRVEIELEARVITLLPRPPPSSTSRYFVLMFYIEGLHFKHSEAHQSEALG